MILLRLHYTCVSSNVWTYIYFILMWCVSSDLMCDHIDCWPRSKLTLHHIFFHNRENCKHNIVTTNFENNMFYPRDDYKSYCKTLTQDQIMGQLVTKGWMLMPWPYSLANFSKRKHKCGFIWRQSFCFPEKDQPIKSCCLDLRCLALFDLELTSPWFLT